MRFAWGVQINNRITREEARARRFKKEAKRAASRCRMWITGHDAATKVARREFDKGNSQDALDALMTASEHAGAYRECLERKR